jgi:hypothetical protein
VKGKPVSKAEAPILVCNHVSPFEPLALISISHGTPVQRSEDAKVIIQYALLKRIYVQCVICLHQSWITATVVSIIQRCVHGC